jgi:hypothetical protein
MLRKVDRAFAAFALLLAGCATLLPPQTASTTPKGAYRVSLSTALSPYCGFGARCDLPGYSGFVLPELQLGARHGLADGVDLGGTLQLQLMSAGLSGAGMVDLKKELWSRPLEGDRRQLLSVGPGVGYTSHEGTNVGLLDLALPLYFGHQSAVGEWVVSARFYERLVYMDRDGDGVRLMTPREEGELAVGFASNGAAKLWVEASYRAALADPGSGAATLSAGVLFDIVPKRTDEETE